MENLDILFSMMVIAFVITGLIISSVNNCFITFINSVGVLGLLALWLMEKYK